MSQKSMTTEDIKKGLENIKKAQLEVLKQLKTDSYNALEKQTSPNKSNHQDKYAYNYQSNTYLYGTQNNSSLKRQQSRKNLQRSPNNNNNYQSYQENYSSINQQSLKSSITTTESSNNQTIQKLKKEFSSEKEQLNLKFIEITNKLNTLEKQSQKTKKQEEYAHKNIEEYNKKLSKLQSENVRLRNFIDSKNQQIQNSQKIQKKLKSQLQLKTKENTILQTEIKSLRSQNVKLSRTIKQLEAQLKDQSVLVKQKKQEKQQIIKNDIQNRVNLDLVMKEVKTISSNHDFLFNKLKDSAATLEMSWVQKQSQIQTSLSRMLEYFQTLSSSNETNNETYDMIGMMNGFNIKNQQSRQTIIKRQFTGTQSRVEDQQELQYFVREMNKSNNVRKQVEDLTLQNQSLKKRVRQLTLDLATYESSQPLNSNNKHLNESNKLIALQLQQMREQVIKLKRYKSQLKEEHEEQQKEIVKSKLKARELEARFQTESRKLVETNNTKYALEKKCQQQDIEITSLNSIIKELNTKLSPSAQSPESATINSLRQEFNKLLQTNSLIQRENQSLKAINDGLQSQITNLKYEKSQFQVNIKQKHQIIDRQIKEKDRLVDQLRKKDQKLNDLFNQVQKLKTTFMKNQQQLLKQKQHNENLLQQKSQQIFQLRKQIEELYKQSRQSHQLMFKYEKLQAQYKELSRKSVKMGETLTHLWSVKEAQYFNIHQILGSFKTKEKELQNESKQQFSGHF